MARTWDIAIAASSRLLVGADCRRAARWRAMAMVVRGSVDWTFLCVLTAVLGMLCCSGCRSKEEKLLDAARNGDLNTVRYVIDRGCDSNATLDGDTALHIAAGKGHESIVEFLLARGVDVNRKGRGGATALHYAALYGRLNVVRSLLDKGAVVNQKDEFGETPLHSAVSNGCAYETRLLIDRGADIEARENGGITPLMKAAQYGADITARILIDSGAKVDVRDEQGWTALHWACYDGRDGMVRLLVERGADVNAKGDDGVTPLIRNWGAGSRKSIQDFLKEHGAK